jgi:DNA-binding transcriptional LysR family regulator
MVFCSRVITKGYQDVPQPADRRSLLARLRFRHLELVRSLADTGSLRETARRLHLSQPAVSKAVREIEGLTGVDLFQRSPQGTALTHAGRTLVRGAEVLLRELDYLGGELASGSTQAAPVLRIGAPPVLVTWTLPTALAAVRAATPQLRVHIFEGNLPQLIKQLERGVLQCVIGLQTPEMLEASRAANVRCEQLADQALAVIAAPGHPLARRRPAAWTDLARADWILPPERTVVREALAHTLARAGLLLPQPVVESAQLATNIELAAAGVGVALAPVAAAAIAERRGAIRRIAVEPAVVVPSLAVLRRAAHEDAQALEALIGALRKLHP